MKLDIYKEIVFLIHSCWSKECFKTVLDRFPTVTNDTLLSIYSQEHQKKIRKSHHKHRHPDVIKEYYQSYLKMTKSCEDEKILIKISQDIDLSPCILARIILEEYLSCTYIEGETVPKEVPSLMMKDPTLVPCQKLSREIQHCISMDEHSGPVVDAMRRSIGLQYEKVLEEKLTEKKIPFLGESHMRAYGYDKTPDFKLQVPIAVDGHVVNWIESKASFGDEYNHKINMRDQLWSYWNRFGPGMVIYWFGYIDELDCHKDKGILLADCFPSSIVTLTSLVWEDDV
ncbi:CDAN1-interacting nuclease 1-like [Xenia sp. Carnegie-2017]|uniref:CDAN1-interacting nuclease 1-like n=1 Tax=Xenia sp. Carnegie-2017 TaxID=2897299 RepID=UPI001F04352D|nr:CDAN1-interacting nuclease 1-like [Xenia sp. Carnegie-2017]